MPDRGFVQRALAGIALVVLAGCHDSRTPVQPAPLTDCAIFDIGGSSSVAVGGTSTLGGFLEFCRPNYLPLSPESITWESLDPANASVNRGVVSGIAAGPAVIQGTYGGMSQQVLVMVQGASPPPESPSPTRLRMYGSPTMKVLQRGRFGVFAVLQNGSVTRVSSSAVWTSSRPSVAGFSGLTGDVPDRAVDAFSGGSTRIMATYQGLTATMTVEVSGQ
jgi:hypothetical protein